MKPANPRTRAAWPSFRGFLAKPLPFLFLFLSAVSSLQASSKAAPTALRPDTVVRIPFGPGAEAIPPYEEGLPGDGLPSSFTVDGAGRYYVLLPHCNVILVYEGDGSFARRIELRSSSGGPLPAKAYLFDFSIAPGGDFLVLDRSGGWVTRFSRDGVAKKSFGLNVGADSLYVGPYGDVVVRDAAEGVLNIFDDTGCFLGELKGPYLSPCMGPGPVFVRTRVIGRWRAFVWLRNPGVSLPRLAAVIKASTPGGKLFQAEHLGFDEKGCFYILVTERDEDGAYNGLVYRFKASGSPDAVFKVETNLERCASLPRSFRLVGSDSLLTFRLSKTYDLVRYNLP